ncbi:hypothetical protein [Nannocystis punicea]|uniref:Uncharacterized protein n=1 Tax=Nannocystis punicea TaxID=2995304 RepID=A0ABY7H020_9BACT|nr:hypothetical protein [Nannocystis poenicansa]WAS92455.1 hypothetical protein O0S08_40265 [Nannocystis poenicansa]
MPPTGSPEESLCRLFQQLYTAGALRRFIALRFSRLANELPDGDASLSTLAFAATFSLKQHVGIDATLFAHILHDRPGRYADIAACARQFGVELPPPVPALETRVRRGIWVASLAVGLALVLLRGPIVQALGGADASSAVSMLLVCLDDGGARDNAERFEVSIADPGGERFPLAPECTALAPKGNLTHLVFDELRSDHRLGLFLNDPELPPTRSIEVLGAAPIVYCHDLAPGADACASPRPSAGCDPAPGHSELFVCIISFMYCCI